MATTRKAVHFGAGNIGRGFLAQLYSQSGWETVFVDIVETVIAALNARGSYTLEIAQVPPQRIRIERVRGVKADDAARVAEELASCDLCSTAVGARVLPVVAKGIARGLEVRAARRPDDPLDVLLCENLHHASQHMRRWLMEAASERVRGYIERKVGLVETVISRMIPVVPPEQAAQDPLYVKAEAYGLLPVDATAFRGPLPSDVRGFEFSGRLPALESRKLYSHNCGHALTAYFGYLSGYSTLAEALDDGALKANVRAGMGETARALASAYGFAREEMAEHVKDLLARFANVALGDTVLRVGRDPMRKLAREDRLVGGAILCLQQGVEPRMLCEGIRAAFRFAPVADDSATKLQEMLRSGGIEDVLHRVCGLSEQDALWAMLVKR